MVELKTLKDIDLIEEYVLLGKTIKDEPSIPEQQIIDEFKKQLRQEAIKWIKAIRKGQKEQDKIAIEKPETHTFKVDVGGLDLSYEMDFDETEPIIRFIKHFFNITEEDLK